MSYQNPYKPTGFGSLPVVTKNIILINVIVFVAKLLLAGRGIDLDNYLALHHHLAPSFQPYQFVTYLFMHADFQHILFNMLGVYVFGQALEQVSGLKKRYLIFYIVTGLGAAVAQYLILNAEVSHALAQANAWFEAPDLSPEQKRDILDQKYNYINSLDHAAIMGASGSLFGLLGAFGLLFPNTELYFSFFIPIKAKWLVIIYGAIELVSGIRNDPRDTVAHFAHLGGLLVGIILVLIWRRNRDHFY